MNKKVLIFWLMVVFGFLVAVFFSLSVGTQSGEEKNITLDLDVKPGVFYKTDKNFHVNLHTYGNQSFSYFSTFSNFQKYRYLQFSEVEIGQQYHVVVQINNGYRILFQDQMLKGKDLMLELPWFDLGSSTKGKLELKIIISPNLELGLNQVETNDVGFNALKLLPDSFSSRSDYWSAWLLHQPSYGLSSLNYWQKQGMPIQMAVGILIWLTTVLLTAWFLRIRQTQVILFLMLLILPTSYVFSNNQLQLKRQSNILYEGENEFVAINGVDNAIKIFAKNFISWLNDYDTQKSIVLIQSNYGFEQSRLLYHLHELDVFKSVDWTQIATLKKQKGVGHIYAVFSQKVVPKCQWNGVSDLAQIEGVELVLVESGYCVVKI